MLDEDNIPNWGLPEPDTIPSVLGIPANELRAIETFGYWTSGTSPIDHR